MPRIKIEDLPVLEELSRQQSKGIFGGRAAANEASALTNESSLTTEDDYYTKDTDGTKETDPSTLDYIDGGGVGGGGGGYGD